jgi:hypothetical protein
MKVLLRFSIVALLMFAGYGAFAASDSQPAGLYGPAPTCQCRPIPPSAK